MTEEIKYDPAFILRLAEEDRYKVSEAVVDFIGGDIPHYACASIIVRMHGDTEDDPRRVDLAKLMVRGMNKEFCKAITPTWTKDDQLAGKLPEVGARVRYVNNHRPVTVIAIKNRYVVLCADGENDPPYVVCVDAFFQYYLPVETPKENADRLQDEYLNRIAEHYPEADLPTARVIYSLSLSGSLPPVPAKAGE